MKINCKILDERWGTTWPLPYSATSGSAAIDLRAAINNVLALHPGECELIPSGLAVHIADPRYAGQILPRSGMGHKHGLVLGNLVGLIDSDYQGELLISCWNRGKTVVEIEPGKRIAQLIVIPVIHIEPNYVDAFEPSKRGVGGYGHTGSW